MYMKNTKTQVTFVEDGSFENPFINYSHNKHFSLQTSLISQQIKTHLDKQIFTLHYPDNRLISHLISDLNNYLGSSAKIRNKAGHRRRIALSTGNSRIVVYSEPSTHQDPIVVVLYGSARFESHSIKKLLSENLVIETCGTGCKSLSVKTSKDTQQIIGKFISDLGKLGYQLMTDTKHRNYYYLQNRTWETQAFRVTLRYEPIHAEMAPAIIQIDKFTTDETSYVDLVWLLKSIQLLNMTVKPHEIEYQVIFPGADESIVLDLLRKVTLKAVRKLGYSNGKGVIIPSYNVKTSVGELLTSTHYIGNSRSAIQIRIYKKPDEDPKLEFIFRERFLSNITFTNPGNLFNNNIWDFISNKVVFGTLDVDTSRRSKNTKEFQKAQQRSRTSLHWAKQELPANPYRYIVIDEQFTRRVSSSFVDLRDLLKYVWNTIEGEASPSAAFPSEITQDTAANTLPTTTKIFPELKNLQPAEVLHNRRNKK